MASDFNETVSTLFKGMDSFLTTKTVVGEPTKVGDTIILPLVDVNFGVTAGAFGKSSGTSAAGGMGGKMSPSAVLVIQNGQARMVSVKGEDTVSKVMDMVPTVIDKIATLAGKKDTAEEEAINKAIDDIKEEKF